MSPISRRSWRTSVAALGVLAVLTAAGAAAYKWMRAIPLPDTEVMQARRAYVAARLAPGIASEDLALADSLSTEVERLWALERNRRFRLRSPHDLAMVARALSAASETATAAAAHVQQRELDAGRKRRTELEERLHDLAAPVRAVPGARRLRRASVRAELALGRVEAAEERRDLAALSAQLDSLAASIGEVEELLASGTGRLHDAELRNRWQRWVDQTVAATRGGPPAVIVDKQRRRCVVIRDGKVVARYRAELGRNGLRDKLHAGDGATPEGRYRVTHRNAGSRYHRALLLNYPDEQDRAEHDQAVSRGRIPSGLGPGGLIEIHGHGGRGVDWTDGCVALRNVDIEELFATAQVGTPVTIVGAAHLPGDGPRSADGGQ